MTHLTRHRLLTPAKLWPVTLLCMAAALFGSACTVGGSQDTQADNDASPPAVGQADEDGWITLFNGEDLTGWTPKFSGEELGTNYLDTFRVEDGKLVASYENWESFGGKFGHLFYQTEYSHYILHIEYRFVGEQVPGGPGWAFRNNGAMIHGQPANTMRIDQDFPASIEVQMLGGAGQDDRGTGNICTPGTHVAIDGEQTRRHVINTGGPTIHGDEWVTMDIEVHGSEKIIHRVNGQVVVEYGGIVLDTNDADGKAEADRRGTEDLDSGTISLQAESHSTEFRNIRLKVIDEDDAEENEDGE